MCNRPAVGIVKSNSLHTRVTEDFVMSLSFAAVQMLSLSIYRSMCF